MGKTSISIETSEIPSFDPQARPIVLCADDYGLSSGVSQGIAALIAGGRLTATGCMALFPAWPEHARELRACTAAHPADVGLHLTLTDHAPLTAAAGVAGDGKLPPLSVLLPRALAGALPRPGIAAEIDAQLDAFESAWGAPPDFVDGHQHVHLLPGVRGPLLAALARRYGMGGTAARPWLRNCAERPARCVARGVAVAKSLFISLLAAGFGDAARRAGFAVNDGFAGIRPFERPLRDCMPSMLRDCGPRPLLHVHPGRVDAELVSRDSLTVPREEELAYLGSGAFAADLRAAGLRPTRYSGLSAAVA